MRRAFLGLLLLSVSAAPSLADYNVSGRFVYIDREEDHTGFTGV